MNETILRLAVEKGDLEIVKKAIQGGTDINGKFQYDQTLMHMAMYSGHGHIIDYLIENGAQKPEDLQWIKIYGYCGMVNNVKSAISEGEDVNYKDETGSTLLMDIISFAPIEQFEIIEALIENGAEINAPTSSNSTALIYAARRGHVKTIDLLVKKGATIDTLDDSGWDALYTAVAGNKVEAAELLINLGADVNRLYLDWQSPNRHVLKCAMDSENTAMIEMLKRHGAEYIDYDNLDD